jgi:hypothetical protein
MTESRTHGTDTIKFKDMANLKVSITSRGTAWDTSKNGRLRCTWWSKIEEWILHACSLNIVDVTVLDKDR